MRFGLLTDFSDAAAAELPEDEPLLARARSGIEYLNEKYRDAGHAPFFLFHRPRSWNPRERTWMGYERKRGKLADLNLLLRGEGNDRFALIVGDVARLAGRQVRHHAGCRHRTAARHRAAACRRHGAPAEHAPLRRKEAAR